MLLFFLASGAAQVLATTFYVNVNNTAPLAPYDSWSAAATNIQDAVDVSQGGDLVLVTNGIYEVGYKSKNFGIYRLLVTNSILVASVNGPGVTLIRGFQTPGTTNGDGAIRCVYLEGGGVLSGLTLTNAGQGAIYCQSTNEMLTNCIIVGNSGSPAGVFRGSLINCMLANNTSYSYMGGAGYSVLRGCVLSGNVAAFQGGAASFSTLDDCVLNSNRCVQAAAAYTCTLNNCALTNNSSGSAIVDSSTLNHCSLVGNSGGGVIYSTLNNCLLQSNSVTGGNGGGAFSCQITNCLLIGNSARGPNGGSGGGAMFSTLRNCLLSGNTAQAGGGAYGGTIYNCTVVSNSTAITGGGSGGGIIGGNTAFNSIIYYNTAATAGSSNYFGSYTFNNCCTVRSGPGGSFNNTITNAPRFVDLAGGNLHLQSNSPCINAGNNQYVTQTVDLDGNPRIVAGTVDIGAYEFQSPASAISYAWLQQYGFSTDGSADYVDPDADQMNNWQEWKTGTVPTNSLSVLKMLDPGRADSPPGVVVRWQSVAGINYFLQRSTNLAVEPVFSVIQTNISGQAGTTTYTDIGNPSAMPSFYRVGVSN